MVGVDVELGGPEVAAQPFDGPDDASVLEVEGRPRKSESRVARLV